MALQLRAAGGQRALRPEKAAERSPRIAEQPLRLYNEGHPLPAIAQMLVSSLRTRQVLTASPVCTFKLLYRHVVLASAQHMHVL